MKKIYFIDDLVKKQKNIFIFLSIFVLAILIFIFCFIIKNEVEKQKNIYEEKIQVYLKNKDENENKEINFVQDNENILRTFDKVMQVRNSEIVINHIIFENGSFQIDGEAKNSAAFEMMLNDARKVHIDFLINDVSSDYVENIVNFDLKIKNEK